MAVGRKTGGRVKGTPNKVTASLKDMILQALDKQGGVEYLYRQADENPSAFMTLVGKVLPTQLTGEDGGAIQIEQKVVEDADAVARSISSLAERARAARLAGTTQH